MLQQIDEFAQWLNSLKPQEREDALRELKDATRFCWNCGYDEDPQRACQCDNDE